MGGERQASPARAAGIELFTSCEEHGRPRYGPVGSGLAARMEIRQEVP